MSKPSPPVIISTIPVSAPAFTYRMTGSAEAIVAPSPRGGACRWLGLILAVCGLLVPWMASAGTWTPLSHTAPSSILTMLLLSDGSVMAEQGQATGITANWYRLQPDSHGSYANGTWSTLAPMHDSRLYFSSQVLTDGRIFVAGGEYGSATNKQNGEVYDPVANTWTLTPTSGQVFYDSISEIVSNGNVLIAPVFPSFCGHTVLYNPTANTWLSGPTLVRGCYQDEASWVKLPDNSILTIDPFGTNTERYIPSLNAWVNDRVVPVPLYDSFGSEMGAGFLLPDGRAFFLGSTGHTALYTPAGTTSPGTWTAGPNIPNNQGTPDAPAAMMFNGKILCAVSPVPTSTNHFPSPTSFYEYDPVSNSFTSVSGPTGATLNMSSFDSRMLDLPDGRVLFSLDSSQLFVYTPSGTPLAAGKPTISSITQNFDGSYHLTGTQLNGISEGAAYGDDAQMNSDYPIVRLTDGAGNVYYARTYNWSSTSVETSANLVTTEFTLPPGLGVGTYSLVVVANGISSDPVSLMVSEAPPPPGNLVATPAGASQINLVWSSSSGAASYIVYRGGSFIATTSSNNYFDTGLAMATTYCYTVAATNAAGASSNSAPACATTFTGTTNTNLLAYWTFDEGSGSIAYDYSGNSNTGAVVNSGGNWTSGMVNGALFFDGASTQVAVTNSPSLNPLNAITIAAWVNAGDWFNTPRILEKGKSDNQYGLLINGSGQLEFLLASVTNGTLVTSPPSAGTWHHVAGTYDGSSISLYIDGQLTVQQSASGPLPVTTDPLAIGDKPSGSPLFVFYGIIDDVRIYGSALSASRIAQLYNTDSVGDGIANWWRLQYFGNGSTTGATTCATCDFDSTGQNNTFKYVTGLDPTDSTSIFYLQIASVTNQAAQQNLLFDPLASGRTYTPQFSTDLASQVWLPLPGYSGPVTNGNQVTITDMNAVQPRKFYRIDISHP
jgi:Concanavalin A-like lectin/glucanases superfamily/Kelch motif